MIGILVTSYNRPEALRRSLPQLAALGAPVLVVDDGSDKARWTRELEEVAIADYLYVPHNRGLAAAMNIGLSYWLADKSVEWISYFQDDVDVHPDCLKVLAQYQSMSPLLTGHDAGEHKAYAMYPGYKFKKAIRATHMHGRADFWRAQLPIPTNELGTPKRKGPGRGMGSNVDWWIVRDGPNSTGKRGHPIVCVPGLVRSFLHRASDSCWNNEAKSGEEPPLRA